MRLTAELVQKSLSYTNPLRERELDLRGHKIPTIENLGAARDQECIDFTDNDLAVLANFPLSQRLQTLLLARNRISSLQPSLAKSIPNLRAIVLAENNISELADLDPLQGFSKLTYVSLLGNPVTNKENYRYYVLWRCPNIRFLDFQKVKDAERNTATMLFGTFDQPTELAQSVMAVRSGRSANFASASAPTANGINNGQKMKMTDKEKAKLEALIKKASSLGEIQRLEKALAEGRLPAGVVDDDAMDET